jgi:microcystin-dependent protein
MANWANPQLTSTYTNFVAEVKDRDVDLALQFDGTSSSSIPTGAIRWDSTANRWKKWNGSSWAELTGTYALTGLTTTGAASIGTTLNVTGQTTLATATATTPATADNSTNIATTAHVKAQGYAPLASPTFTGSVTIPSGASIAGYLTTASAAAAYATLSSPALSGTPTAPTPALGSSSTQIATTAFVAGGFTTSSGGNASGTWGINVTGSAVSATTQDRNTYSTAIATTAYVKNLFGTDATSGTLDWNHSSNTQPGTGPTLLLGNASNGPGQAYYYHPLNFEYGGKTGTQQITQLAISYASPANELYMRGRYSDSWSSWVRFFNTSNYNAYVPTLTGTGASGTWGINVTGSSASCTGNANTAYGLNVHGGRNNEANKVVRTDSNGYLQTGYINSSSGDENNASNADRVWGTNGSDSYLRTYRTSALSVNYANSSGTSGSCTGNAATATALSTYGSTGQILTSQGASVAPTWTTLSGTPAGAVDYFAMSSAPTGYLKANGALISRSTYATLFDAIGTTFGAGDGTTFALPDLRGEFLRGWDDARGVDSGRGFGSTQADEIRSHSHSINRNTTVINATGTRPSASNGSGVSADISTNAAGGAETRPRNIALLACIKF